MKKTVEKIWDYLKRGIEFLYPMDKDLNTKTTAGKMWYYLKYWIGFCYYSALSTGCIGILLLSWWIYTKELCAEWPVLRLPLFIAVIVFLVLFIVWRKMHGKQDD
jgi:hypothetical protein